MIAPRVAVRGLILHDDRLLLVNAWPVTRPEEALWCAPGGGMEAGASLPDNLRRELFEETGLQVTVGAPCLVNEFHDPDGDFHQVDIYFRCQIVAGRLRPEWRDPAGVVSHRRWFSRVEMAGVRFKPDSLPAVAWGEAIFYDPLEPILKR